MSKSANTYQYQSARICNLSWIFLTLLMFCYLKEMEWVGLQYYTINIQATRALRVPDQTLTSLGMVFPQKIHVPGVTIITHRLGSLVPYRAPRGLTVQH